MKRLRHYNKGSAIVLSCFGSVTQVERYNALAKRIQELYPNIDVRIALTSRMVIKKLARKEQEYQHLPLVLAQLDLEGFQRILVVPVYLFPTDEYLQIQKTVAGFREFSLSNIEITPAIIHDTHNANALMHAIHERFSEDIDANIFICHGAPYIDNTGHQAIAYVDTMLSKLSYKNNTCTLEGAWAYDYIAPQLIQKIEQQDKAKADVRLIPLLLVSGNHFENDVHGIKEQLEERFNVTVAQPIKGDSYCLLDEPQVQLIIDKQISDGLIRLRAPLEDTECQA